MSSERYFHPHLVGLKIVEAMLLLMKNPSYEEMWVKDEVLWTKTSDMTYEAHTFAPSSFYVISHKITL